MAISSWGALRSHRGVRIYCSMLLIRPWRTLPFIRGGERIRAAGSCPRHSLGCRSPGNRCCEGAAVPGTLRVCRGFPLRTTGGVRRSRPGADPAHGRLPGRGEWASQYPMGVGVRVRGCHAWERAGVPPGEMGRPAPPREGQGERRPFAGHRRTLCPSRHRYSSCCAFLRWAAAAQRHRCGSARHALAHIRPIERPRGRDMDRIVGTRPCTFIGKKMASVHVLSAKAEPLCSSWCLRPHSSDAQSTCSGTDGAREVAKP